MSLFTRMAEGAGVGGVLGTAIGTLVGGAATTAVVAFTAPVSIPVMFATGAVAVGTTLTTAEFGGAVGTLTGAGAGAVADVEIRRGGNKNGKENYRSIYFSDGKDISILEEEG